MKKQKLHIRLAWVILICFVAGQTTVFSHRHYTRFGAPASQHIKKQQPSQTVTDKCNICDMMHHSPMAIFGSTVISPAVTIIDTQYTCQHDYIGIALILSAGRSPPTV